LMTRPSRNTATHSNMEMQILTDWDMRTSRDMSNGNTFIVDILTD
jgi:hypothetical protein